MKFWVNAPEKLRKDVGEMLQDSSLTFAEIGRAYDLPASTVQSLSRTIKAPDRTSQPTGKP